MTNTERLGTVLGLSMAVAACGAGAEKPSQSPTPTQRQTHTEVIVGACPPDYVAPWEAQPTFKNTTSAGEIELVSFVKPSPTPKRDNLECFYTVEVDGPAPTESPEPLKSSSPEPTSHPVSSS